jgi:hypothetical protein
MKKEDREWLDSAMKAYTFDDSARMKEVINELKSSTEIEKDKLTNLLEELLDLVEMHPRSNLNFCLFGGLLELMSLIFSHPDDSIRKLACSILSSIS